MMQGGVLGLYKRHKPLSVQFAYPPVPIPARLAATLLVQLMTPALALFYGGFVSANAIIHTMMCA